MDTFPRRRSQAVPQLLSSLAELLGASPPEQDLEIRGIAPVAEAGPDEMGFLADGRYLKELADSRAGALLVTSTLEPRIVGDARPRLVVEDGHIALLSILDRFFPEEGMAPEVHPTAVLGRGVRLGQSTRIGPYAVVESAADIGDGVAIAAHVVVGAGARIGSGSILYPGAVVYPGVVLGERVVLHAGACVGVDGFGYTPHDDRLEKVPQVGPCVIEDDVEIGANTTIDRGSIGPTRIGAGTKIDNLVQIGHNVTVGRHTVLAGQVGVAGSTRIGSWVQAGGQVGFAGHMTIGDGVRLAAQSGVTGDIPPRETVEGYPARPRMQFLRATAAQAKVPELVRRVRELERKVGEG
jgi:UDP-3-O-[3-hydroxymyristoyl] glucosamine N-acyltransferase